MVYLAIFSSKIASRFGIPALLLFIGVGILAGSDGIGGIYFDNYFVAQHVGIVALSFILFSGGLSIEKGSIRPVFRDGLVLATVGVFLTALIVAVVAHKFLNFPWIESLLLGSIISSTDAAAVFSVLRSRNVSLKGQLKPLLEFESGSNDPMAVFLTVGVISLIAAKSSNIANLIPMFLQQMIIGGIVGYLVGKLTIYLINRSKLEYDGLYSVLTIATVIFSYSIASLIGGNGFLAVYVAGLIMASHDFIYKNSIIKLHDGIAWLMQIGMFLTLGLLVFLKNVAFEVIPGVLIAFVLMFIARPIAVFLTLHFSKINIREKLMISWVGLRGAAPIVLATFPLLAGVPEAHRIFNIVFFVVIISVIFQGTSIPFVAKLLKVDAPLDVKPRYPIEFEATEGIKSELVEIVITVDSPALGKRLQELGMPSNSLIVLIFRDNEFVVPNGSSTLEKDDLALVLADKNHITKVKELL